jgi:3-oxoacyl-[acyl-carrier protein] reductase
MKLKDKAAIITGSARGIGQAYAIRFAEEGAKVVICDVLDCSETKKMVEARGGICLALKTDVTSKESTMEMKEETIRKFGKIDILINNAAFYGGLVLKSLEDTSVEEWDKVMAINLKGLFLCSQAVVPQMKKQKKGKIINISSAVFLVGVPMMIHYSTSKGGVVGFTRALASELGKFGINVNALAPGYTMTNASKGLTGGDMAQFEQMANYIVETQQTIKRRQEVNDLMGPAVFLASDDSDFINGVTIPVSGGQGV